MPSHHPFQILHFKPSPRAHRCLYPQTKQKKIWLHQPVYRPTACRNHSAQEFIKASLMSFWGQQLSALEACSCGRICSYLQNLTRTSSALINWSENRPHQPLGCIRTRLTKLDGSRHPIRLNSSNVPHANLWGTEQDFVRFYGEPIRKAHDDRPPQTDDLSFATKGDIIYLVSFWEGHAHEVNVSRIDHKALTDEQVQQALKAFSGGEEWSHQPFSGLLGRDRWSRTGAIAWMVPARKEYPDKNADVPETMLTISTNEFSTAWNEANHPVK